jgi:hypothetical protein
MLVIGQSVANCQPLEIAMKTCRWSASLGLALLLAVAPTAWAQQSPPHLAYVYPAGGQQGDSVRVTIGGQYLNDAAKVYVSGDGIRSKVVACIKPLTQKQVNELRDKLQELRKKPKDADTAKQIAAIMAKLAAFAARPSPVLAEKLTVEIALASDAEVGQRELRVATGNGLSNPLVFDVGWLREVRKRESRSGGELKPGQRPRDLRTPHAVPPEPEMNVTLPVMLNGQIMQGGVDRYRFVAHRGEQIVVIVAARRLIPYLADAVPGWFQAKVSIYDPQGNELACADHYRFHPDPVLYYKISKNGQYVLEIRDTLYRGREDFVYRIAVGELPFVTSIFPLGGRAGTQVSVALQGWNLATRKLTVDAEEERVGTIPVAVRKGRLISNDAPFAVDTLPERVETEPNNTPAEAQRVTLPVIVNGRIDPPGDQDVFCFEGRAGDAIVAEVDARKLDSPLDSLLRLTDATGKQLALNDDFVEKETGLSTHHADSLLTATLPTDGLYYLHLNDAQQKGGAEYAYRLRISTPRPDFALRVVPSSINVRAGGSVPLNVYAIRKDGFSGEIDLAMKDAPEGFKLSGGRVPGKQDQAKLTLTAPNKASKEPVSLRIEGRAMIEGREVVRPGVAAEDMMQAFIYRHLVPMKTMLVAVAERRRPMPPVKFLGKAPVRLQAGGTAPLRFSLPRGPMSDRIGLALHDPPAGISIQKTSATDEGVTLLLGVSGKVKLGLKGNLIVDVSVERPANPTGGKPAKNRLTPLGTLPAIPFEIVDKL